MTPSKNRLRSRFLWVWSGHIPRQMALSDDGIFADYSPVLTVYTLSNVILNAKSVLTYLYLSLNFVGRGKLSINDTTNNKRSIQFGNYITKQQYYIVRHKTNQYLSSYLRQQRRIRLVVFFLSLTKRHKRWTFNQHRHSSISYLVIYCHWCFGVYVVLCVLDGGGVWVVCVFERQRTRVYIIKQHC